ncbi:MAG: hypothetical protein MUF61_00420 [archaeon]|jgi:hypothetical protein|nr:hypothetical protein [archaeon]
MKALIFDSGALITLSMNGLLEMLIELKKVFGGKFLITRDVKYEIIDRPIGVYRFELEALRVQHLIDIGVLELPESVKVSDESIKKRTKELMNMANHTVQFQGRWVQIVSDGEISCLALSDELEKQGVETMIAIDERTTRVLVEKPTNLREMMSEKMHHQVEFVQDNLEATFSKFRIIRSSEIVFVAYKKGLIDLRGGKKVLEALLYATKFKGSAISHEEIEAIKRL